MSHLAPATSPGDRPWQQTLDLLAAGLADGSLGHGRAQFLRGRVLDLGGELPADQQAAYEAGRERHRRLRDADEAGMAEAMEAARAAAKLRSAGLPAGLADEARWEHPLLHAQATASVRSWCALPLLSRYLLLQGPVGCGKSCLVTLAMVALARRDDVASLRYVRATAALDIMGDSKQTAPPDWWSCGVLCLDDLGAHVRPSEWALATMADLIDGRGQDGLTTIVTINAARRRALDGQLGPRIIDRLTSTSHSCAVLWPADFRSLRQRG